MPRTSPPARHLLWNDLGAQQRDCFEELSAAWEAVTASTTYLEGPFVERFEADWAERCDRSHAVGVGNAHDAVAVALAALDVRPGDEIVVPANAAESTAGAVGAVGGVPVFVDVHPDTLLARDDLVEHAIGPRTVGIVVVDHFGQPVDVDAFEALADRHDLFLLEDATHAPGARWRDRPAGSFGDVSVFGFPPDANLGALGEAGIVLTDDDDLLRRVRRLARRPDRADGDPLRDGAALRLESRLDALQAAMLSTKLPWLDTWNAARRALADRYRWRLADSAARTVAEAPDAVGVYRVAAVRTPRRTEVRAALAEAGIETRIPWATPCHLLAPFAAQRAGRLPVSEEAGEQLLALPLHPHLTTDDVDRVCAVLATALERSTVAA